MILRRKLALTMMILMFAVASLGTATFAWFTISQNARAENISMDVITNEGLMWISLDNENFYESVSWDQIKEALAKQMGLKDGDAVASQIALNSVTTSDLDLFMKGPVSNEVAKANVDYVTFTLYFRTKDAGDISLFLCNDVTDLYDYATASGEGTYAYGKGKEFVSPVEFKYSEDKTITTNEKLVYNCADAVRFGFKEIINTNKNLETPDTRDVKTLSKFIWDVASEDENDRAYGYGNELIAADPGQGIEEHLEGNYGALGYFNAIRHTSHIAPTGKALKEVQDLTIYDLTTFKSRFADNTKSKCGTFLKGTDTYYYAAVQVYIWLEGWDGDCFDGILGDTLKAQLAFRTGQVVNAD